ncbi:restriction endonuclease subunit S [Agrobacterium cavarae]|uniref:restriction endonuclease subunit S n=1 Tax=Agrobacterium cavarae TaxID=2528239 RepID=UPI002FFB7AEF
MIPLSRLFDVKYGVNLELNACTVVLTGGLNFVSRTARNNGVSARVLPLSGVKPIPAGTISVAGGGSVMESFLQPEAYYSGRDLYYLIAKEELSDQQKLFYCACLRANKYRFNYGRQANRTLKDILVPQPSDIPSWVAETDPGCFDGKNKALLAAGPASLRSREWKSFEIGKLFDLKKGKRLTKASMKKGNVPFIGAIDSNNGLTNMVQQKPLHPAGTITVNYNGNGVAEAYYQPVSYRCSDDVNVLYPKFDLTPEVALFICTAIRHEKYRFSYGRKWHLDRMESSTIGLPVTSKGKPDLEFMQAYIRALPFSSQIGAS